MQERIKLSICCITYKHEQFIAQAIESFLMQRTDFAFEIVVGEDASPDNTRAILKDYEQRFPGKFKLLLHDKNIGMIPNFYQTLYACTGEYIAICEGDDYWTDPNKLQLQTDFMDAHPEYTFCLHRVVRKRNGETVDLFPDVAEDTVGNMRELIKHWNIAIGSMVLRRNLLPGKQLLSSAKVGDQSLCYGLAAKGDYYFMKKCMGDYRYHEGGITNNPEIFWDLERIKMFLVLAQTEGRKYRKEIFAQILVLMQPKISALQQISNRSEKLRASLGFAKELFFDFEQMPFALKAKIFGKLMSNKP